MGIAYGLAFGAAMVLAFPMPSLWGFAWVMGLAVAAGAWQGRERCGSLALGVAIGSLPAWAAEHLWIMRVSELGYPFLALYNASWTGALFWATGRLFQRWPTAPMGVLTGLACCAVEVLRGEVVLGGYPWYQMAHPLIDATFLAGAGAVIGVYGLSALMIVLAGGVVDALVRRRIRVGVFTISAGVMAWVGCSLVPEAQREGVIRAAVVQTDNPQNNRTPTTPWELVEQMQALSKRTREAAVFEPDFIAWPESMMPGRTMDPASIEVEKRERVYWKVRPPSGEMFELDVFEFALGTLALQAEIGIPMLVGSEAFDNLRVSTPEGGGIEYTGDHVYNSVFLVVNGAVRPERYDKMFLTPFGEVMPGIRHWPWLQDQLRALGAHGMPFDLTAGAEPVVLEVPRRGGRAPIRVVTPICFEATMPNVCRRLVYSGARRRADLIVNGTNDGWFNTSRAGRAQHMQGARWRCVELGTPMARAANTGVSALVDHRGRVVGRLDSGDGVLSGELPMIGGETVYGIGGWMAAWAVGGAGVLAIGLACFQKRGGLRRVRPVDHGKERG
jgi:apolipoprotein N-acyltransferase